MQTYVPMNRIDAPNLDRDLLINDIHSLQVTLSMMATQLARDRQPEFNQGLLTTLSMMHQFMLQQAPNLRRH